MALSSFDAKLPDHCTPTTHFLIDTSVYFHTCIPTPLAFTSTLLGTLSIVSWLFAQMPQIYKNHQLQSTAGLSIFFLSEWLLGDATNLVGALLTHQAAWQIVVAGYYVFVDVCLVVQFFWYTYIKPWKEGRPLQSAGSSIIDDDDDSDIINGLSPINTSFVEDSRDYFTTEIEPDKPPTQAQPKTAPNLTQISSEKASIVAESPTVGLPEGSNPLLGASPRTMLYIATICALLSTTQAAPVAVEGNPDVISTSEIIGMVLSWSSCFLYLGSRLPQLYKNWIRRSTAGLSPLLFVAAFCGNSFYATSLLTTPNAWEDFEPYGGHGWVGREGSKRSEWIAGAAPFFFGAAGVLFLDAFMGVQFVIYGERDEEKIVKVWDSHGRSRWERVSGWMRGWVPTVNFERKVPMAEGEALIRSSREIRRHSYGAIE